MSNSYEPQITISGPAASATLAKFQEAGTSAALQTRMSADISIEHLASVSVARAEAAIRQRLASLRSLLRPVNSDIASNRKILADSLRNFGSSNDSLSHSELEAALRTLFDASQFQTNYDDASLDLAKNIISCNCNFSYRVGNNTFNHTRLISSTVPQETRDLCSQIETLETHRSDLMAQERLTLNALTNVDSLEKKAKATLTEAALKQTESGQAILDELATRFDDEQAVSNLIDSIVR